MLWDVAIMVGMACVAFGFVVGWYANQTTRPADRTDEELTRDIQRIMQREEQREHSN